MDDAGGNSPAPDLRLRDGHRRRDRPGPPGRRRGGRRGGGLPGDAGPGQHASPPVPDADAGGAGRRRMRCSSAGCRTLYPIWARLGPEQMRVSALTGLAELALSGCTHDLGSSLPLPERRAARRHDRGGGGDRPALPSDPRRDVHRRERGRAAAGRAGRGGGGDPRGLHPRDRRLPRSAPRRDGAGRRRALFALLGQPRADARRGAAGARQGREAAHPSGRERRGRRLFSSRASAAGRDNMPRIWAGPATMSGTPIA